MATTKPTKLSQDDADKIRRGDRLSPDASFVVDFADPHNPLRAATAEEAAKMDAEQAAAEASRKAAERDVKARAAAIAGATNPAPTPPATSG